MCLRSFASSGLKRVCTIRTDNRNSNRYRLKIKSRKVSLVAQRFYSLQTVQKMTLCVQRFGLMHSRFTHITLDLEAPAFKKKWTGSMPVYFLTLMQRNFVCFHITLSLSASHVRHRTQLIQGEREVL